MDEETISKVAGEFYTEYCEAVGGKAYNGDPLPTWKEFSHDPAKTVQYDAWRTVAKTAMVKVVAVSGSSAEYVQNIKDNIMDITSANYVKNAIRTESMDFEAIAKRMCDPDTIRLLHSAMGLSTEAGEFLDMLKKHIFYGKELDLTNAKEEIGDSMWYAAIGIDVLRTTLNDVMQGNINKLRKRYPEKFNKEDALCRDLDGERKILEDL